MKTLILIFSLLFAGSALADNSITEEQNDLIMTGVCENIASYYALGEAWGSGLKGVSIESVRSSKVAKDKLAVIVSTLKTEDYLLVSGPKAAYFCYRCDDGNFQVSLTGGREEVCK